jgi:hypothetical protein
MHRPIVSLYAVANRPLLRRGHRHHGHSLLAGAGRLPPLGKVVPDVISIEDTDGISGPAAQQIGASHRHEDRVRTAPVMTH